MQPSLDFGYLRHEATNSLSAIVEACIAHAFSHPRARLHEDGSTKPSVDHHGRAESAKAESRKGRLGASHMLQSFIVCVPS